MNSLLWARSVDILVNVLSGSLVVAIAFAVWYLKEEAAVSRVRSREMKRRAALVSLFQSELDTIVSFTEKCTVAANALEQFAVYQQWLVANSLLSWKENRLVVQTWQQTSGTAEGIRMGQVSVGTDVIADLVADMRKTEFPAPSDDNFRWPSITESRQPDE